MKQKIILVLAYGILVAGLTSPVQAGTLAKVDGTEITDEMFDAFAAGRSRKPSADLTPEERKAMSDELIKLVVVGTEARKKKLHAEPDVAAQLKLQEFSLLAQAYIQRQLTENPVSEAQMKALYDEKYSGGSHTEFKARHILVSSPTTAANIIGELDTGGDFVELAAKNSIGPSAKTGGDLGWFTKEAMVGEFADAVEAMAPGTYSRKPVQTQFGWHVILKEEERTLPAPDMNAVGGELQRQLQQQAVSDLVDGLREKAKVKTYD